MSDVQRTIFISYRQDDHPDFVARIRDWFTWRYGDAQVFMDINIPPTVHFTNHIQDKVRASDVLIAIIGPQWLDLLNQKTANSEKDLVRIEITIALTEGKLVAPLCIKGAAVPPAAALPPDLKPMLDRQAAFINSDNAFHNNIESFMNALEQELERRNAVLSAETYFKRALERKPNDLNGKIADYTEAIRLNPQYARTYNNRGLAHYNQMNYDAAIADYTEAICLNPQYVNAIDNRGEAYFMQQRFDKALADFKQSNDFEPDNHFALAGLALTHHALGDINKALGLWRLLVRIDTRYKTISWIRKELNWAEPLVEEARKLIAKL